MSPHQTKVRDLFFQTELSATQIAQMVGVSERSVYRWAKEGRWQMLKTSAACMPAVLVDNFRMQLSDMQEQIGSRTPGQRIPTIDEANIMSKLVLSMSRIKVATTLSSTIEVMCNFIDFIKTTDHDFALKVLPIADRFLGNKSKTGYEPYSLEFDAAPLSSKNLFEENEPVTPLTETDKTAKPYVENKTPQNPTPPTISAQQNPSYTPPTTDNKTPDTNNKCNSTCPDESGKALEPSSFSNPIDHPDLKPPLPQRLPNGLTWLGRDKAYDPHTKQTRELRFYELQEFKKLGYRLE